ncbi:MAG: hypothetical protein KKF65_06530 [Nanoarchaeota archaeon]|nr:hypothetical protein [Nanoarchaeota archaeon]
MNNKTKRIMLAFSLIILAINTYYILAQPTGASIILNETVNVTPSSAAAITTAGGSFTTLVLNVTQQNARWKAYVGNVSGTMVLQDSNNISIYNWNLATITGEVYSSRSDNVNWSGIRCLTNSVLSSEETFLNITTSSADSINKTFNWSKHKSFWVGNEQILNSSCKALATYVNDTSQTMSEDAAFQEILLDDGSNLIYSTVLEQDEEGYDISKTFDFQMILAEDEYATTPTTYYFYAEIG